MLDVAQSQLLALVAGAVLASSVLGVGALEAAQREDLAIVNLLDSLAARVAGSGCSAARPTATVDLNQTMEALPESVLSLRLFQTQLRATRTGGPAVVSIEFPPLLVDGPMDLLGAKALVLHYAPLDHRCRASTL